MSVYIHEADWKLFRQIRPIVLDRFCQRVLAEVERLASDADASAHERYLAIFDLMRRRDKELAAAFDDPRRSTALRRLAAMQSLGLLTDQDLAAFSPETRDAIRAITGR